MGLSIAYHELDHLASSLVFTV